MFACVYICISIVSYSSFVAEQPIYSVLEETADKPDIIYSSATNAQMPAQPAACSDLIANDANVYHLVSTEGEEYENLGSIKK